MSQQKTSVFLQKLNQLRTQDIQNIKGVGPILAENLKNFLESPRYKYIQKRLLELEEAGQDFGVEIKTQEEVKKLPLNLETICITGSFDLPREEIKSILIKNGAKVVNSITQKTTTLLAGEKSGSKLQQAKQKNLKVVSNLSDLNIPSLESVKTNNNQEKPVSIDNTPDGALF